jgi:D-glycero-D-manno-heptose 1,7-bisphosphate phosphatase
VVEDIGYLHRAEDVRLVPGAADLIAHARARGLIVGLVTNQSGIGRGFYDWDAFAVVQAAIAELLGQGPEPFDFVAACGTHPEAALEPLRVVDHPWRKPRSGMILMAAASLNIALADSVLIGDQVTDLQAGAAAGIGCLAHVLTGHGYDHRARCEVFATRLPDPRPQMIWAEDPSALPERLGW